MAKYNANYATAQCLPTCIVTFNDVKIHVLHAVKKKADHIEGRPYSSKGLFQSIFSTSLCFGCTNVGKEEASYIVCTAKKRCLSIPRQPEKHFYIFFTLTKFTVDRCSGDTYTVDEAMDRLSVGWTQWVAIGYGHAVWVSSTFFHYVPPRPPLWTKVVHWITSVGGGAADPGWRCSYNKQKRWRYAMSVLLFNVNFYILVKRSLKPVLSVMFRHSPILWSISRRRIRLNFWCLALLTTSKSMFLFRQNRRLEVLLFSIEIPGWSPWRNVLLCTTFLYWFSFVSETFSKFLTGSVGSAWPALVASYCRCEFDPPSWSLAFAAMVSVYLSCLFGELFRVASTWFF